MVFRFDVYWLDPCSSGVDNVNEIVNDSNGNKNIVNITDNSKNIYSNNDSYSITINKDIVHKTMDRLGDLGKTTIEHIDPNIGGTVAAGHVGAAMLKATTGLPPLQRAGALAGSTLISAATTKVGLGIGQNIINNSDFMSSISQSSHGNPDINRVPSPDNTFINSPLENGDLLRSPL